MTEHLLPEAKLKELLNLCSAGEISDLVQKIEHIPEGCSVTPPPLLPQKPDMAQKPDLPTRADSSSGAPLCKSVPAQAAAPKLVAPTTEPSLPQVSPRLPKPRVVQEAEDTALSAEPCSRRVALSPLHSSRAPSADERCTWQSMGQQKALPPMCARGIVSPMTNPALQTPSGVPRNKVVLEAIEPTPDHDLRPPSSARSPPKMIFASDDFEDRMDQLTRKVQATERTQAQLDELTKRVELLDRRISAREASMSQKTTTSIPVGVTSV